jgi:hypothetical protein
MDERVDHRVIERADEITIDVISVTARREKTDNS